MGRGLWGRAQRRRQADSGPSRGRLRVVEGCCTLGHGRLIVGAFGRGSPFRSGAREGQPPETEKRGLEGESGDRGPEEMGVRAGLSG